MDRLLTRTEPATPFFALPSRQSALAACREGLESGGPVVLTGAAGVGKTWLARQIATDRRIHWTLVEASEDLTPSDVLRAISVSLGQPCRSSTASEARIALADALSLANADGMTVALHLDEAHLASDQVLEEVRLLSNRLQRPNGVAAILISGQTPLAMRLGSQALSGLESRLSARIHLLPLDLDEASVWLGHLLPDRTFDKVVIESWHLETQGNPRRLLRLASRAGISRVRPVAEILEATPSAFSEPLVPAKPPLRVEDGLIEVGWDSESESENEPDPSNTLVIASNRDLGASNDEPIEDHYAALQAWEEWSRNQGRGEHAPSPPVADENSSNGFEEEDYESSLDASTSVWPEGRQSFGPYSQLFSRLKPLKEEAE